MYGYIDKSRREYRAMIQYNRSDKLSKVKNMMLNRIDKYQPYFNKWCVELDSGSMGMQRFL